jgi:transcriptional regulator with XRE-family HTH domain
MTDEEFLNAKLVGARNGLGSYLLGLRKRQGKVSLEAMAHRVGCAKSYLWEIEAGGCNPSLSLCIRLAREYKTTVGKIAKHYEVLEEI